MTKMLNIGVMKRNPYNAVSHGSISLKLIDSTTMIDVVIMIKMALASIAMVFIFNPSNSYMNGGRIFPNRERVSPEWH